VDFTNVPASAKMPFTKFPEDFSQLPTVSYIIPNLHDDMHSGWPVTADQWLKDNLSEYAAWAMKHNSLLVVTWDESHESNNQIPTIFFGPMVQPGKYSERITQLNVLRTIEDMYSLAPTGEAAAATPITDVFNRRPKKVDRDDHPRHHAVATKTQPAHAKPSTRPTLKSTLRGSRF
jgi:hypothetical protein